MRITVIGTGYLGATHAACLADLGHDVRGIDIDAGKVATLMRGQVPFHEHGLDELLRRGVDSGRLRFATEFDAADAPDLVFICAGTPQRADGIAADIGQVVASVRSVVPLLARDTVVVGKSTVPVGTAAALQLLADDLAPDGVDVRVAWNPEFLREGHAVEDTLRPDRLVLGVADERSETILRELYAPMIDAGVPLVVTDLASAELVKSAANAFLATKISFINAIADVCDAVGADVLHVAEALGYDTRIGGRGLSAGLGFGGGCLPKDLRALMAKADELGADQVRGLLREVNGINMQRRTRVVHLATEELGGRLLGRRIGVLGAAFKPGTDDSRDSPALNVAAQLQLQGAHVVVYDPQAGANARAAFPTVPQADSVEDAVRGAELTLLLTEWREFVELDPRWLSGLVRDPVIIDARNALDADTWADAGWTIRGIGRPRVAPWTPPSAPAGSRRPVDRAVVGCR